LIKEVFDKNPLKREKARKKVFNLKKVSAFWKKI